MSTLALPSEGMSLGQLFQTGRQQAQEIQSSSLSFRDPDYQRMVEHLALFSANETIDDVTTAHLPYILVQAYLGQVVVRLAGQDRKSLLLRARAYYTHFYHLCDDYGLVADEDKAHFKAIEENISFNAARAREDNIARYKRQKETTQKLQTLEEKLTQAALNNQDPEDAQREHTLLLIDSHVQQCLQELQFIQDELKILAMRGAQPPTSATDVDHDRLDMDRDRGRLTERTGPLLSDKSQVRRPFVITNKREELRAGVFKPSWRLPTMSVDQYLELERERGGIIEGGGQGPSEDNGEREAQLDADEQAQDAETMKQRQWDDFKDDNPRGWGNRQGKG
ncbi:Type 2A phosphatase-associated protein 42 [Dimargaris verticillata]|uniref:Type 2A phosphatase-associated protein 42 n=1 Tax=Dimargaris verticillata TaxID=2761393 RepID=A0A9W8EB07_9FUNG|nr:Type 2A phosphatase-associated protein 42 [Dimargaris verticillata]